MDAKELKDAIDAGLKALEDRVTTSIVGKIEEKSKKETKVVMGATEEEKIVDGACFKGLGHFMVDVRAARNGPSELLQRYNVACKAIGGMGTLVEADGGFLAPATMSNTVMEKSLESSFLGRCMSLPCAGSLLRVPAIVDNTRSGATTMFGGVTTAYVPEGGQYPTAGKVQTEMIELKPQKLVSKVAITEELLEDNAVSAEALVNRCVPEAIRYVRERKVLFGTGAGEPLGAFGKYDGTNTKCAKQVARSGANTFAVGDVLSMVAASYGAPDKYLWLYNKPTCYSNIRQMPLAQFGPSGNSISDRWIQYLDGIPAVASEHTYADMGTEGDVLLADFSQYLLVTKGGVRSKVSLELRFDYGENTYVFIIREDGQPWWKSTLTGVDGSTRSPFVWVTTNT